MIFIDIGETSKTYSCCKSDKINDPDKIAAFNIAKKIKDYEEISQLKINAHNHGK